MSQPRASSVRVVSSVDHQPKTLVIAPQGTRGLWRDLAKTVIAMQPELVEALDEKGNVLRALRPGEDDEEDEEDGPEVTTDDPETARLIIFARLIAEAYRHSTDVAFERLSSLFDSVTRRAESTENALRTSERMIQRQALEAAELAGAGEAATGTFEQEMLKAFLSGQARAETKNGKVTP